MPEEELKKPIYEREYQRPEWAAESSRFEQEFARRLYDSELVRTAGKTALSRVSTLLVRYNRLKQIEASSAAMLEEANSRFTKDLSSEMRLNDEEKKEAEQIADKEKREKELARIKAERERIEARYKEKALKNAVAADRMERESLETELDEESADKDGKVLSTLMLGGDAEGARGYTLTEGGYADYRKGADYIAEVSGEEGTLFDQMSLLDNAVNTEGIRETGEDKSVSLGRMLREMTSEDVRKMNMGTGEKVNVNMELIDKTHSTGDFSQLIGSSKRSRLLEDAAQKRGLTEESVLRQKGKAGKNADRKLTDAEKAVINPGSFRAGQNRIGRFFGQAGSIFSRRKGHANASVDREIVREEARDFFLLYGLDLDNPQNDNRDEKTNRLILPKLPRQRKEPAFANEEDTSKKLDEKLGERDILAAEAVSKEGFLRTISGDKGELKTQELTEESIGKAAKERTAGNILWAYNIMGASKEELLMLRLALIAYMVPTGRKTMFEVIDESKGIDGMMDGIDISEPGLMYKTFAAKSKETLGEDITAEIREEEEPEILEDEDLGEVVIQDIEAEGKILREGLKLPTDVVKEIADKEEAEKAKAEKGEAKKEKAKKAGRPRSKSAVDRQKRRAKAKPAEAKPAEAKPAAEYIEAFGDINAEADDVFSGDSIETNAELLSECLCRALEKENGVEKLATIVAVMGGMMEGADPERFWINFIEQLGNLYIIPGIGSASGGQYKDKASECIRRLKENDSRLKQLVMSMFLQAGGA